MAGIKTTPPFMFDVRRDAEAFEAFPVIHLVNIGVLKLKEVINNGERGCSLKKAGAYLGFRLLSYSFVPTALNLISIVVCGILTLLTLPFLCCNERITRWSWVRLQGSFCFFVLSLFDVTCDARQISGLCCCAPESLYRRI